MKLILAAFLYGLTLSALANIIDSKLSPRHQAVIAKAILEKCHLSVNLTEVKTEVHIDRVDQGVIDYYYDSEFMVIDPIDQGMVDTYKVLVQSAIYSAYDHEAQDWGLIEVASVSCTML